MLFLIEIRTYMSLSDGAQSPRIIRCISHILCTLFNESLRRTWSILSIRLSSLYQLHHGKEGHEPRKFQCNSTVIQRCKEKFCYCALYSSTQLFLYNSEKFPGSSGGGNEFSSLIIRVVLQNHFWLWCGIHQKLWLSTSATNSNKFSPYDNIILPDYAVLIVECY